LWKRKLQIYVTKEMSGRIKTKEEEEEDEEEEEEEEKRKTKLQHNFLKTHCTNQTFM